MPGHVPRTVPYIGSKTQNGFGTFGQPDIAATLVAAGKAIREVCYQKWWVHLRHRPESGGAIVYLQKTGQGGTVEGHVSDTVLNSQCGAGQLQSEQQLFLPQAFPEGSPTHPVYPAGHGIHAGIQHHRDDPQPVSAGSLTQAVMTWYSDTSR